LLLQNIDIEMNNQDIVNIPTGKWKIFGNMEEGELDISSIDSNGNLKGTAFGSPIQGFYHAASGQIHFSRVMGVDQSQVYDGQISIIKINVDVADYLLAGSYVIFTSGFRGRPKLGWYATLNKVI
jgi:hypothetical protein